jgi:predicted nicotinamide N-methyase
VLGADLLYEQRNADRLLDLLPRLGGDVLLADPGRPFAAAFLAHWDVEEVADRVYRLR